MDDPKIGFQGELCLAGWSESHNGGAKVTFWLSDAADLDAFRTMTVRKGNTAGQRFAAVLVEIGDDEQPVIQTPIEHESPPGFLLKLNAKRCAMMCKSLGFQQYVETVTGTEPETPAAREINAVEYIYRFCDIESRSELDTNARAADRWKKLMADYHRSLKHI